MDIKLNINILGRFRGDIIMPGDRYYDQFKAWAENKDIKLGVVICEFSDGAKIETSEADVANANEGGTDGVEGDGSQESQSQDPGKVQCPYCEKTMSAVALPMHIGRYHKEQLEK